MGDELTAAPDSTAVRVASGRGLRIFEVDQPGPQAWKRRRLRELGCRVPEWLRLVPVDFEAGGSWFEQVMAAEFDAAERPGRQAVEKAARASGTPFIGCYAPDELLAPAEGSGFREARHVSGAELIRRCFPDRAGLRTASAEEMPVAST